MSDTVDVFTQTCMCGRTFTGLNAVTWHEKGCLKGKKCLAGALSTAREVYWSKKARIQESTASDQVADQLAELSQQVQSETLAISHRAEGHETLIGGTQADRVCEQYLTNTVIDGPCTHYTKVHAELKSNDDSLPLAQQRPHRIHQLPACYRDFIPEPPRLLPPAEFQGNLGEVEPLNFCLLNASLPSLATQVPSRPKIKTQLNSFSLFWLYDKGSLPIDDPDADELLKMTGLSSLHQPNFTNGSKGITWPRNPLYPYLNKTSLLLGDWYWNYGHQKSQISFKKLLDIIGHPDYHPNDVWNTNWAGINQILGSSDVPDDKTKGTFEWLDGGIGWKKTTIQICIPFHHRTQNPGPKEYIVVHALQAVI